MNKVRCLQCGSECNTETISIRLSDKKVKGFGKTSNTLLGFAERDTCPRCNKVTLNIQTARIIPSVSSDLYDALILKIGQVTQAFYKAGQARKDA